jgi:hypothetical protein
MTMLAVAPSRVTASQVTDAVLDGAWIVDIRTEPAPATEPDAPVGWLVPWEDDIVLLAGSPEVLAPRTGSGWR